MNNVYSFEGHVLDTMVAWGRAGWGNLTLGLGDNLMELYHVIERWCGNKDVDLIVRNRSNIAVWSQGNITLHIAILFHCMSS